MTQADEEARRRAERARQVGLFRYQLIQDVTDPQLSARAAGRAGARAGRPRARRPGRAEDRVSEQTIRRWVRDWRAGGFEALVPAPARVTPRTPAEVLALAVALKRENPQRTAVQVTRILRAAGRLGALRPDRCSGTSSGWSWTGTLPRARPQVFGRFEAGRCNEIWTGDALHGPVIAGRKTYLFAFIDDQSRAVMAARFGFSEDTVRLAAALRPALASRGVPESVYVDNGSAFVDSWLLRACASLGIRLIHSAPGRPQGRGKIERFFRTVRDQFLVEITERGSRGDHRAGRAEPAVRRLGRDRLPPSRRTPRPGAAAAPLAGRRPGPAAPADPGAAARGVLVVRVPHRHQDRHRVPARQHLPGRRAAGRPQGRAGLRPVRPDRHRGPLRRPVLRHRRPPFTIGRHSHPKARPEQPGHRPAAATGIDYLQPDRHRARQPAGRADQLRRPARRQPEPPPSARPAARPDDHRRGPRQRRGRNSEHQQAARPLRVHPDAVRPRPGPRHAAPPRRPRRGRRPDHLVRGRKGPRRDHRRSRRRQDRRRPRRPGQPSTPPGTPSSTSATPPSAPAASTTPSSPPSARPPASTPPRSSPRPPTPWPPSTPNAAASPS